LVWCAKILSQPRLASGGYKQRNVSALCFARQNKYAQNQCHFCQHAHLNFFPLESGNLWSAANAFASKGKVFQWSEIARDFENTLIKPEKNYMDKGCLLYSGYS
jgi:hypothetical protein